MIVPVATVGEPRTELWFARWCVFSFARTTQRELLKGSKPYFKKE
jgi:hypothetical protein